MKKIATLKKTAFRAVAVSALSFFLLSSPVYAAEVNALETPGTEALSIGVQPFSDIIDWRYKTVGGRLYRRLYNYTRGEWASEYWIECV